MSSDFFESSTKLRLEAVKRSLPHAVLLSGPEGVGLSAAAAFITDGLKGEVLRVLPEKNDVVDMEKGTITVKVVRRLYDTARTSGVNKYIMIDYAERMAKPAQNAFLKLLEEPNEYVHFVLLTHQPQLLLPTVLSRVQQIEIKKISTVQSEELLEKLGVEDAARRRQMLFIADGLPAELTRLKDDEYFAKRSSVVRDARLFITGSPYDRSLLAQSYKDDRNKAVALIDDALKLLKLTVEDRKEQSLIDSMDKLLKTRDRVVANGNIRLHLAVAL